MEDLMKNFRVALLSSAIALACIQAASADEGWNFGPVPSGSQVVQPSVDPAWGDIGSSAAPEKAAPRRTRAEVIVELAAARKSGDIARGEAGATPREMNPSLYAPSYSAQIAASRARTTAQ
jgi:hypothetical protein